jgi:hypothetical protein
VHFFTDQASSSASLRPISTWRPKAIANHGRTQPPLDTPCLLYFYSAFAVSPCCCWKPSSRQPLWRLKSQSGRPSNVAANLPGRALVARGSSCAGMR